MISNLTIKKKSYKKKNLTRKKNLTIYNIIYFIISFLYNKYTVK